MSAAVVPTRTGAPTEELRRTVGSFAHRPETWAHLVPPGVPVERWYVRLHRDDEVEVWLLGWGETHDTQLHDHGDSRGSFRVVAGALVEERAGDDGRLHTRRISAGTTVAIERGDVHNVVSPGPGQTLSIHAYSPPLTTMTYFSLDGGLRADRTLAVDGPE